MRFGSIHKIRLDETIIRNGDIEIAFIAEARYEAAQKVLNAPVGSGDGRSAWFWIRLADGDLFLATAPQGMTYEALEGEPGTGWA